MGHSQYDSVAKDRRPWNAGRKIGTKRALKPQQVWAISRGGSMRPVIDLECGLPPDEHGNPRKFGADTLARGVWQS
jgi:hypothetical protein